MIRSLQLWLAVALAALAVPPSASAGADAAAAAIEVRALSHGRFRDFPVYTPAVAPASVVLLLSGARGWMSLRRRWRGNSPNAVRS